MYIYIIVFVLISLLAIWSVWRIYKSFKNRSELRMKQELKQQDHEKGLKKVNAWCEKIEKSGTDTEIKEIGSCPWELRYWEGTRLDAARKRYNDALSRLSARSKAAELLEATKTSDLVAKMRAWMALVHESHQSILRYVGIDLLERRFHFRSSFLEVLKQATTGNRDAFLSLRSVLADEMKREMERWPSDYKSPVFYPSNWDDLVTEHIENPALGEFAGINTEPEPGEIRLLAAEALRTQSLKNAKIVLAFCSIKDEVRGDYSHSGGRSKQIVWPYHSEIGDVLLAELAKMVDQIHQEKGLCAQLEEETM